MIQYFPKWLEKIMIEHARETFPDECCGVILNDRYIPCENVAENKRWNFQIQPELIVRYRSTGNLQAIIHSHVDEVKEENGRKWQEDYGHASKDDMIRQAKNKIPYGIVHLNIYNNPVKVFYFGDQLPVQDLKGRPFIHGVYDCYGLLRDYYNKIFNIKLNNYPRYFGWWNEKENSSLLEDNVRKEGFIQKEIDYDWKHGDVIFMQIKSHVINHCAVYTKNGLLIHHLCDRLSHEHPVTVFRDNICRVYRHKELM